MLFGKQFQSFGLVTTLAHQITLFEQVEVVRRSYLIKYRANIDFNALFCCMPGKMNLMLFSCGVFVNWSFSSSGNTWYKLQLRDVYEGAYNLQGACFLSFIYPPSHRSCVMCGSIWVNFPGAGKMTMTKTKVFLESKGQNLFRTVEKTWKNQMVSSQ